MKVAEDVGVLLGALDLQNRVRGVGYRTRVLQGWWEPTVSNSQMEQRGGASGGRLNEAHSGGRRLVLKGSIESNSHTDSAAMLAALFDALPVNELTPLVVVEGGVPLYVMVRREDRPVIDWLSDTHVTFDIQLHGDEWRRLGGFGPGAQRSVSVGLPWVEGGRVRPYTLPTTISATVVSGSVTVDNNGGAPAPVSIRFDGPVQRPGFHTDDGQALYLDLDVLAGQSLVLDLDAETVLLNGVSRQNALRGDWPVLRPGSNTFTFDAAAYNTDARMTVSWSEARK